MFNLAASGQPAFGNLGNILKQPHNSRVSSSSFFDFVPQRSSFIQRHMSACSEKEENFGVPYSTQHAEPNIMNRPSFNTGPGISELLGHQQSHKMSFDVSNFNRTDQK